MNKYYCAIDNGTSGTIAIIAPDGKVTFIKTPIRMELSYTKKKQNISRINVRELKEFLNRELDTSRCRLVLERPGINPGRFKTTLSAMRALEATLIVLEELQIPFSYIDSKEWQKAMLPSGLKGPELKKASLDVGRRLFPTVKLNHPDCDGLLMAEYARRQNL